MIRRYFPLLLTLAAAASAMNAVSAAEENAGPPPLPEGFKLVWSDEFDKDGLPDPAKWGYEKGFVRNKEAQYYTDARKENTRVENGHLVLEGIKEEFPNAKAKEGSDKWQEAPTAHYTSGSILTRGKADWKYGRIEVRAQVPQGKGMWPAIWMLGSNIKEVGWPKCGEIDIMEYVGKEPNHIFATVHWFDYEKKKHNSRGNKIVIEKPFDAFHIYTVDWTAEKMEFYFNDKKVHTYSLDNPTLGDAETNAFHKPHYLILNLALGGSWGGELDDSVLPQKFMVDYVRVYQ